MKNHPPLHHQALAETHSRGRQLWFRAKVWGHTCLRVLQNTVRPARRFSKSEALRDAIVIGQSESLLWNPFDTDQNRILTAGKIENLRIACRKLDGLEIPGNALFSFWKQLGNPNYFKGYVRGREIREGCIVPVKGGGLCQLSNALYDAALTARMTIHERHRHTKIVRGSLAEQNRDATVKWNYVDLRFSYPHAFRIEAHLTASQLVVTFKSLEAPSPSATSDLLQSIPDKLNDCVSCGNTSCHAHRPATPSNPSATGFTTFLADHLWPEHVNYLRNEAKHTDFLLLPTKKGIGYLQLFERKKIRSFPVANLLRSLYYRNPFGRISNIFARSLVSDQHMARTMASQIPVGCTHLVIPQNLLPFLWQTGVCGGRTFDVWMTRNPADTLHETLNSASIRYPESPTLNDFRAPEWFIEAERQALNAARHIITPHHGIATQFTGKAIEVPWVYPTVNPAPTSGHLILFPGSALARKGAIELRNIASEFHLKIAVSGKASDYPGFWNNVQTIPFDGDLSTIRAVIYPAIVEHQPRLVLKAIAHGIPVFLSDSCGIVPSDKVHVLPANDHSAWIKVLSTHGIVHTTK